VKLLKKPFFQVRGLRVADTNPDAHGLVGVAWADPPTGGSDLCASLGIDPAMNRGDQMRKIRNQKTIRLNRVTGGYHGSQLLDKRRRIDHASVTDHILAAPLENPGWNLMENNFFTVNNDRVPGIGATLKTDNHIHALRQQIYDLPLAFVAPLGAEQNGYRHD